MTTQTVSVPVKMLLQTITHSVDVYDLAGEDDWFDMIAQKMWDDSFWALVDTIPEKGFLYPICVQRKEWGWVLGNGHHRLAAAILLGLDNVPVVFSDDGDYMCMDQTTPDGRDFTKNLPSVGVDSILLDAFLS